MKPIAHGFTLLEMAITLAIVAFLLGGLMMTLGAQQDVSREQETARLLVQAREALYGFAMQNGRLPCPANGATASGAAGAGIEVAAIAPGCTGGVTSGVLPWATLGLPETDAWGRRFSYTVTPEFARSLIARNNTQFACSIISPNPNPNPPAAPTQSSFALCTPGTVTVTRPGGAPALTSGAPAIVVSHGPNGFGAFMSSGSQVAASSNANEIENANGNLIFRDGTRTDTYDDSVEWLVASLLMNRMVQAGRLP